MCGSLPCEGCLMPLDDVNFSYVKHGYHVAKCRMCGISATHLSSTGVYQDQYLVCEDGSYDEETNTFICWNCYRNKTIKKP